MQITDSFSQAIIETTRESILGLDKDLRPAIVEARKREIEVIYQQDYTSEKF